MSKITIDRSVLELSLNALATSRICNEAYEELVKCDASLASAERARLETRAEEAAHNEKLAHTEADAAMRAALAQHQQEPFTDAEIEAEAKRCGGRWNGDAWVFEDADLHPFARSMIASTQARKPLTDDEIEDIFESITGHSIFGGDRKEGRAMYISPDEVFGFYAAVEAARGIKP